MLMTCPHRILLTTVERGPLQNASFHNIYRAIFHKYLQSCNVQGEDGQEEMEKLIK